MTELKPTYENLTGKNHRQVRSACCGSRVQVVYSQSYPNPQLVYSCNQCSRVEVVRESEELKEK